MASEREEDAGEPGTVAMPAPTAWPMMTALGIALLVAGLVTHEIVSMAGVVVAIAGAVGWFREVFPDQHHEHVRVDPAGDPVVPLATRPVESFSADAQPHRARLPVKVFPYSAGLKGGIAGGVVMAALALLHGTIRYGSPWYTVNLLAAMGMASLANANTAQLAAFNPTALTTATIIHGVFSLMVGMLYGVLLPMFPRHPAFFGGILAPLLWTGLIHASLGLINPIMNERIDWPWFVICQIAFGLTAGFVVARSERIQTFLKLPLSARVGIEGSRESDPEDRA